MDEIRGRVTSKGTGGRVTRQEREEAAFRFLSTRTGFLELSRSMRRLLGTLHPGRFEHFKFDGAAADLGRWGFA
jgi:hypothetical protein